MGARNIQRDYIMHILAHYNLSLPHYFRILKFILFIIIKKHISVILYNVLLLKFAMSFLCWK